MKRFLHHGKIPLKSIVDLAFHHQPPPNPVSHVVNSRPAIINIHGIFGSRRLFRPFSKPLANALNTDVYSVDLRNHGDSPIAQPFNYVSFTKDVIHFIKKHIGDKRPVQLIGFSLGAKVALLATLCSQINASKCIAIDAPPYETVAVDSVLVENYELITKIINQEIKIEKGSKNWKKKLLKLFQGLPANATNNGDPSLYFANGFYSVKRNAEPPTAGQDPYIEYSIPLEEFPNLIDEIIGWPDLQGKDNLEGLFKLSTDSPALFMKAMHSLAISDDYSLLKKHFPRAVVKEIDSGHNMTVEKPEESLQCMIDFLKDS
ncbi:ZYRO0G11264p [Zygosaccharomyces rouxii]|uniref:ZYRO0G11264p n=1 Tax=Zygosaccharomyces rouxii (strain ATCC 2623 / CBS 732 / NBRC 1130 / NCYC 568 / NRRL Y-229) TaxID=559307 RepID=C5E0B2_ZYGRC|nr:uncharacterized protein ZYRO0G11264g [Zygosaccharomyces rouxii]KAH9202540.1 Alpha/Beta hydrolase protein [Zygosaccharomyces rouxii]CAR29546.1 ZYRO0G11264p [Zygosaccharomyces rouxii]